MRLYRQIQDRVLNAGRCGDAKDAVWLMAARGPFNVVALEIVRD
jgi:hypothetical protein